MRLYATIQATILATVMACGGKSTTVETGCVTSPVAGAACTAGATACASSESCGSPVWTCDTSTQRWDEAISNVACPADGGIAHDGGHAADGDHVTDAGSTPCGTSACTPDQVCVETTSGGGACLSPPDGGVCPGSATGPCCNTYVGYACAPRPAACGANLTCACAKALCGDGGPGVGGCQTGSGSILQCAGEEFP
jgi:hypothetical protein